MPDAEGNPTTIIGQVVHGLYDKDERIAELERVIAAAFDALESNNEAEAFLILKTAVKKK